MKVDETVVANIAELAQLEIQSSDLQEYALSMGRILNLVEEMQDVDTEGVEPMSNPLDGVQVLRKDVVTESNQRDNYQEIAPATENGFYLVPKVID